MDHMLLRFVYREFVHHVNALVFTGCSPTKGPGRLVSPLRGFGPAAPGVPGAFAPGYALAPLRGDAVALSREAATALSRSAKAPGKASSCRAKAPEGRHKRALMDKRTNTPHFTLNWYRRESDPFASRDLTPGVI
jgi:hypothetical protein